MSFFEEQIDVIVHYKLSMLHSVHYKLARYKNRMLLQSLYA